MLPEFKRRPRCAVASHRQSFVQSIARAAVGFSDVIVALTFTARQFLRVTSSNTKCSLEDLLLHVVLL